MQINFRVVDHVTNIMQVECRIFLLNSSTVLAKGVALSGNDVAIFIHVDDFGIFTESKAVGRRVQDGLRDQLVRTGFDVTTGEFGSVSRYIGLLPRCSPPGFEPVPLKLGLLDMVLER